MWNWGTDKLNGSDARLRKVFCARDADGNPIPKVDPSLCLPRRSNNDYQKQLDSLLELYLTRITDYDSTIKSPTEPKIGKKLLGTISLLRSRIPIVLLRYHNGFPAEAYNVFEDLIDKLVEATGFPNLVSTEQTRDGDKLYRMRSISDSKLYPPKEVFHVPTNHRELIHSGRYSIAGFPSLYLTTSLNLATRETSSGGDAIVSRFEQESDGLSSEILDLGIRPDDFDLRSDKENKGVPNSTKGFVETYLAWYPILAACSFIRANPYDAGFHDEYVIPQLLMQWLRRTNMPPYFPPASAIPPEYLSEISDQSSLFFRIEKLIYDIEHLVNELKGKLKRFPADLDKTLEDLQRLVEILSNLTYKLASIYRQSEPPIDLDSLLERYKAILDNLSKSRLDELSKKFIKDAQKKCLGHIRRLLTNASGNIKWTLGKKSPIKVKGIRYFSCRDLYATNLGRNYVFPSEFGDKARKEDELYSVFLAERFSWTKPLYLSDYKSPKDCEMALNSIDCIKGEKALKE